MHVKEEGCSGLLCVSSVFNVAVLLDIGSHRAADSHNVHCIMSSRCPEKPLLLLSDNA